MRGAAEDDVLDLTSVEPGASHRVRKGMGGEFLRLGAAVEVLEPGELRERIVRTVSELAARYGNPGADGSG